MTLLIFVAWTDYSYCIQNGRQRKSMLAQFSSCCLLHGGRHQPAHRSITRPLFPSWLQCDSTVSNHRHWVVEFPSAWTSFR
ncbi:hypothetical protein BDV40DRAFT_264578 [Aspergillus tamarii]|uniref:Uncharacterized protein n=1 Tax=Aspergillus tamarii TaxID=41984 RepID=A0A5N6UVN7_ASPTM|nr:hypothetical protein BDV40DRAFT_264578 [Aspergillus tamarii]